MSAIRDIATAANPPQKKPEASMSGRALTDSVLEAGELDGLGVVDEAGEERMHAGRGAGVCRRRRRRVRPRPRLGRAALGRLLYQPKWRGQTAVNTTQAAHTNTRGCTSSQPGNVNRPGGRGACSLCVSEAEGERKDAKVARLLTEYKIR